MRIVTLRDRKTTDNLWRNDESSNSRTKGTRGSYRMLNTTRGGVDTEKDCDGNYGKNNEVRWLKRYSDSKTS